VSVLDALPVVDHEDAGTASVQKVPVEWIEALLACRVQPPEKKALPPFVEVARGGVDLRLLRPARGPGAASVGKPARAAKPRRRRGVCCARARYGCRAVVRQRMGLAGCPGEPARRTATPCRACRRRAAHTRTPRARRAAYSERWCGARAPATAASGAMTAMRRPSCRGTNTQTSLLT